MRSVLRVDCTPDVYFYGMIGTMDPIIRSSFDESIRLRQVLLADVEFQARIRDAASWWVTAFREERKLLFCGNGGSAADAQHLAAELSGRYRYDRDPLPAEALHVNTSFVTAVANDYGYDEVFARMVKALGQSGDILVALSTSGNSPSILRALEAARDRGMRTIGLTGAGGGRMATLCDLLLEVPSHDTPRIQECHMLVGHILCEITERELFPQP